MMLSAGPSPSLRLPAIRSRVCMWSSSNGRGRSADGGTLLLVRVVERQRVRRCGLLEVLAAYLELLAVNGVRHLESRERQGLLEHGREHRAGHHSDLPAVGINRVTQVRGDIAIDLESENLDALLALGAIVLIRTAKVRLARTDGELKSELPERVARWILLVRIGLRHVVRIKEQRALHAQHVERAELRGYDPEALAFGEDGVPDMPGVLSLAKELVATLTGVSGARDEHGPAEQRRGHMVEVLEVANAGHVLREEVHRNRSLQRQVVQIIIDH